MSGKLTQALRAHCLFDTKALLVGTRIGVRNRYKYVRSLVAFNCEYQDYSVEDEYFEREMTLLEARHL